MGEMEGGTSGGGKSNYHIPKMPFPKFDGTNPRIWIGKAVNYFTIYNIPRVLWVTASTVAFDDNASKWLQVYKLQNDLGTWEQFNAAVEDHFGTYDYKKAMNAMLQLKQKGSVEEFYQDFLNAKYQLHMHNTALDDTFFVQQFMRGLKEEIKSVVQAQDPDKLERAVHLASLQEDILATHKYRGTRSGFAGKNFQLVSRDNKQTQGDNELWKARQARDYKKANNLCYYCSEPYSPAHIEVCKKRPKKQIHQLSLEELTMDLTNDLLLQLEQEDAFAEELYHLSVNAMSRSPSENTIRLRALVKNQVMLTLVDSGSSDSFVSSTFINRLGLPTIPAPPAQVRVADGSVIQSKAMVPKLTWWIQGYTFQTDMRVIDLNVYDAILGYDWLKPRSPRKCH
jgi:hypothetical protein